MRRRRIGGFPGVRIGLSIGCVVLGACASAPGMRMPSSPDIASNDGNGAWHTRDEGAGSRGDGRLPVYITDISLDLINALKMTQHGPRDDRRAMRDSAATDRAYAIGVGDVLQITVWDHPELAGAAAMPVAMTRPADAPPGFVVDQAGGLRFPYVGWIEAAGLQVEELRARLAERLARWFHDPQVTVRIASFRAKRIYVEGEVREPGAYPLNDVPTTLHDAVGRAGGFSAHADQSRVIFERNGVATRIDLSGTTAGSPAIVMKGGDLLRVRSRDDSGVFVMGEVNKPVKAIPPRNGRLMLSDAIAQAGSLNQATADTGRLYVIRGRLDAAPRVYRLDATSPVAMVLASQFELEPNDVVYVDGSSLVRFNRVLSLLMPAVGTGLTAAIATQ